MITRKVSPPEHSVPVGDPFFYEWFLKNGKRMAISRHIEDISLTSFTKKAPVHRGFLGSGIVPTGELEDREDHRVAAQAPRLIVPTGELEDREDSLPIADGPKTIVPTGELEDREDSPTLVSNAIEIVPTGELEDRED